MPTRRQDFQARVHELESEFETRFPGKPTAQTQSLVDRIRRALSWLTRAAELSEDDRPPRFVDLWIALNALYGQIPSSSEERLAENGCFQDFLSRLDRLPSGTKELLSLIGKKHIADVGTELVENKYLWNEWWHQDLPAYQEKSGKQLVRVKGAIRNADPIQFFTEVFDRLHVLRNQIIHGSSSAKTRKNRDALYPAILLLEEILPSVVGLMIREGLSVDWPKVPYPGKDTPQFPE